MTAFTEHKCQVVFTVDDQGETSFVESSVCQSAHYVTKLRNAAMNALIFEFEFEIMETALMNSRDRAIRLSEGPECLRTED